MDTIQKFVRIKDEPWFILIHTEIEARAAPAIRAIGQLQQAVLEDDVHTLKFALGGIAESLEGMIGTLSRMPAGDSPDVHAVAVRPYRPMVQGLSYAGVE